MINNSRRRSSVKSKAFQPPLIEQENGNEDDMSDSFEDDSVPQNSWFYDGILEESEVKFLETKEQNFWTEFINNYLLPIHEDKEKKVDYISSTK